MRLASALLGLLLLFPLSGRAERLDWEPQEAPAGPALSLLRGARDGMIGLFDAVTDLQLGLFAEGSLLLGSALMVGSDAVGLVDDNPITQYVFKAVASKSLAKTAYLFNLAGAEAVLGSHGLEKEWYVDAALTKLNPLLDDGAGSPSILLEPLDFFDERVLHTAVYGSRVPGTVALASLGADGVLRPLGCLLRIVGLHKPADSLQANANQLVRRAVR